LKQLGTREKKHGAARGTIIMAHDDDDNDNKTIINLDDTRVLKRMAARLNMQVEHLNFSSAGPVCADE
jgi:hypothetical protein